MRRAAVAAAVALVEILDEAERKGVLPSEWRKARSACLGAYGRQEPTDVVGIDLGADDAGVADVLLSFLHAARYLDVHERTVERLVADGRIAVVRVTPKTPRIRRSELERFMSELDHQTTGVR